MREGASILHVDMDAFFVSVEVRDRPELAGKPVVVAGDSARSVVASASYASRHFGVRSAMPLEIAKRRCPDLIVVQPNFGKYRSASEDVMGVFHEFTPLVEQLSIDEAFLDVAGARRLFGDPGEIALQLKRRVRKRTKLPCSVGGAGVKFVAKLASAHAKPDGVLIVDPERTIEYLHPLSVRELWGVGGVVGEKLRARGIHTIGDLAREPLNSLASAIGHANAVRLYGLAHGRDERNVEPFRERKSVGHEETFPIDISERGELDRVIMALSVRTAEKLRTRGAVARTIALKLRRPDFSTLTRSRTLTEATSSTARVYSTAVDLFTEAWTPGTPVRLLGVRAEQLQQHEQDQQLWSEDDAWRPADSAMDATRQKFGDAGLLPAKLIPRNVGPSAVD